MTRFTERTALVVALLALLVAAATAHAQGWYWLTMQVRRTQAVRDVTGALIPNVQAVYARDAWGDIAICTRLLMRGDTVLSEVVVPAAFCEPVAR